MCARKCEDQIGAEAQKYELFAFDEIPLLCFPCYKGLLGRPDLATKPLPSCSHVHSHGKSLMILPYVKGSFNLIPNRLGVDICSLQKFYLLFVHAETGKRAHLAI